MGATRRLFGPEPVGAGKVGRLEERRRALSVAFPSLPPATASSLASMDVFLDPHVLILARPFETFANSCAVQFTV